MQSKKETFGTVAADRSSSKVNANEHFESGHVLLTIKSPYRVGQARTLVFGAFATVFVAVASILLFYGCKKEGDNLIKQHKMLEGDELKEYEKYTPSEATVGDKLLMFTNYVNDYDALMPNMELKEAVWFMETFFNIGVCEKQKQFVEYTHSKKTYLLNIPINEWNEDAIILNGTALQARYREVLLQIVTEICPEYSLNFGDVYVNAVNDNRVTIGITVLYGTKGEHKFSSTQTRWKILPENKPVQAYPSHWFGVPPLRTYLVWSDFYSPYFFPSKQGGDDWILKINRGDKFTDFYLRDSAMEIVLNREPLLMTPTAIVHYKKMRDDVTNYPNWRVPYISDIIWANYPQQGNPPGYLPKTPSLTATNYQYYGQIYKDYIYEYLCNDFVKDGYPNHSPFLAGCFYLGNHLPCLDCSDPLWQDFGLEWIAIFEPTPIPDGVYEIFYRHDMFLCYALRDI